MELIRLKLVWQTGKLLQQCGKQKSVWRCELRDFEGETSIMPLKTPSPILFCAVPGISNNSFTNHSWFAVDYFWIALNIFPSCFIIELFHPVTVLCAISSDVFPGLDVVLIHCSVSLLKCVIVEMHPATWFSGSLEVNTVDMCTVPTSTESITTAWTLSVTTRWAWVLHQFFLSITQIHSLHFHLYAACFSIMSLSHRSDSGKMR